MGLRILFPYRELYAAKKKKVMHFSTHIFLQFVGTISSYCTINYHLIKCIMRGCFFPYRTKFYHYLAVKFREELATLEKS
jgi:hypothetical protein